MGTRFESAKEAMNHLVGAVSEILSDGWRISGIDPSSVTIQPEDPGQVNAMQSSVTESGYDGDVSVCCGAPAQRAGTCLYCTACGSSSGCS